ncbi:MAG TPA: D-alanyl-D-alanine carboxypeptidase family protein [Steroidobacter sp.]
MYARIPTFCLLALLLALAGCSDEAAPVSEAAAQAVALPGVTPAADTNVDPLPVPAPPKVEARGYYLMDYDTGRVLAAANENERLEPASLTKLMSAYVVFAALESGRIALDDMVHISRYARSQEGSRMFVEAGSQVSVENLLQGVIVQSGNDATVALAEHVAGSEPVFVDLMNKYAQQLGMTSTHFQNSPGMPAPDHYTTARDIAVLAAALIREFPQYYKWYSQREFTWNNITQPNRNGLLARDPTVDGLKTGHTESAGYCLVSSAKRDGMRLISVVMGSPSIRAREDASAALLNYGFSFYETRQLFTANSPVLSVELWKGQKDQVRLAVPQAVYVTIPRGQAGSLHAKAEVTDPLLAPLTRDNEVGKLQLSLGSELLATYPLHPVEDVPEAGFLGRMIDTAKLWIF